MITTKNIIHTRRTDLLSILTGLELLITSSKMEKLATDNLEKAKALIEVELKLRASKN